MLWALFRLGVKRASIETNWFDFLWAVTVDCAVGLWLLTWAPAPSRSPESRLLLSQSRLTIRPSPFASLPPPPPPRHLRLAAASRSAGLHLHLLLLLIPVYIGHPRGARHRWPPAAARTASGRSLAAAAVPLLLPPLSFSVTPARCVSPLLSLCISPSLTAHPSLNFGNPFPICSIHPPLGAVMRRFL